MLSAGWKPAVVHVDTANRPIDDALARPLAGERRYVDVAAGSQERTPARSH
jgi:hypothetical protein